MKTQSENQISSINSNVFFREFTFSKNDFRSLDSKQQLEFADNVVWLHDIFIIFQIKEKGVDSSDNRKWFQNKILNKAVKQIKSTLIYLKDYTEIFIENEKGHKLNISEAKENDSRKIIIYHPTKDFPEDLRQLKFYQSSEIGLIHLMHSEDYSWICKFLITPCEIDEYLSFRERLFLFDKKMSLELPEQYFLAHFLETPDADHFDAKYINTLRNFSQEIVKFDISGIVENFAKKIQLINYETEYYPIITELALLNRFELAAFKERFLLCIEKSENADFIIPYKMHIPRTDCAFVFIPLHSEKSESWKKALNNFTLAQKYDTKSTRCIGVVIFRDPLDKHYFLIYWQYVNEEWKYDEDIEKLLNENYPFRKSRISKIENRYKS
jgi:hypothetical protein